jgi:Immunity protein 63
MDVVSDGSDGPVSQVVVAAGVSCLAAALGLPELSYDVPSFDFADGGYPGLRVDEDGRIHYVVRDRGETLLDLDTDDLGELLYWCAEGMTRHLAWSGPWDGGGDRRRGVLAEQARLLHRLDPAWALRWRREMLAKNGADEDVRVLLPEPPFD